MSIHVSRKTTLIRFTSIHLIIQFALPGWWWAPIE